MLGIKNYELNLFQNHDEFLKEYQENLRGLIGQKIDNFWVMWDVNRNKWNTDAPIILKIENLHLEFAAFQLDFSLTINSIDLTEKLDWYEAGEEMPLFWKKNEHSHLVRNLNQPIEEIRILITKGLTAQNILFGIEFKFPKQSEQDQENFIAIFNALDELGLSNQEMQYDDMEKIIVVG